MVGGWFFPINYQKVYLTSIRDFFLSKHSIGQGSGLICMIGLNVLSVFILFFFLK